MLAARFPSTLPAWFALLITAAFASAAPATQNPRKEAAMERAEKRVAKALATREKAYAALVAEYETAEAWVQGEGDPSAPPPVLENFFRARQVPAENFPREQERLAEKGSFYEIWNSLLYRRSRIAKDYAAATEDLESTFMSLSRLRHPERFQRGFDKTPPGMALVPGDRYPIGPATGDLLEQPQTQKEREVRMRQFYLDRREVSCAEYSRFLMVQPLALREEHLPDGWTIDPTTEAPVFPDGWGNYPVAGVSWVSATRYADWAGKRLPTEDEWEAAAAGTERRRYPLGNQFWVSKINCREHGAGTSRNSMEFSEDHTPLGLICMTGNVREWTASGFNGKEVRKAGPETYAAVRGGSYLDDAEACQSTYRWLFPAREKFPHIGFRCAKDVR